MNTGLLIVTINKGVVGRGGVDFKTPISRLGTGK